MVESRSRTARAFTGRVMAIVIALAGLWGATSAKADPASDSPVHTLIGLGFDAYALTIAGVEPAKIPQLAQSSWLAGGQVEQLGLLQGQLEALLMDLTEIRADAARHGIDAIDPLALDALELAIASARLQIKTIESDLRAEFLIELLSIQSDANVQELERYVLNRHRAVPAPLKVFAVPEADWQLLERAVAHVESGLTLNTEEQAIYFAVQADPGVSMARARIELNYQSVNDALATLLAVETGP